MDVCEEYEVPYELILTHLGNTFEENRNKIEEIVALLEEKYPDRKKGIFMPGKLPETYQIIGFDNSPISREAVIPTSTVGQQISLIANEAMKILSAQMEERKKRRPSPLKEPVHKVIPPILIRRETTA